MEEAEAQHKEEIERLKGEARATAAAAQASARTGSPINTGRSSSKSPGKQVGNMSLALVDSYDVDAHHSILLNPLMFLARQAASAGVSTRAPPRLVSQDKDFLLEEESEETEGCPYLLSAKFISIHLCRSLLVLDVHLTFIRVADTRVVGQQARNSENEREGEEASESRRYSVRTRPPSQAMLESIANNDSIENSRTLFSSPAIESGSGSLLRKRGPAELSTGSPPQRSRTAPVM